MRHPRKYFYSYLLYDKRLQKGAYNMTLQKNIYMTLDSKHTSYPMNNRQPGNVNSSFYPMSVSQGYVNRVIHVIND